jgi:hypothetical protein
MAIVRRMGKRQSAMHDPIFFAGYSKRTAGTSMFETTGTDHG